MEKEILLKEIENTNHLNDLYQLWNEFKAYLENQPSLLELGQLFGFNYHLQEKFCRRFHNNQTRRPNLQPLSSLRRSLALRA